MRIPSTASHETPLLICTSLAGKCLSNLHLVIQRRVVSAMVMDTPQLLALTRSSCGTYMQRSKQSRGRESQGIPRRCTSSATPSMNNDHEWSPHATFFKGYRLPHARPTPSSFLCYILSIQSKAQGTISPHNSLQTDTQPRDTRSHG